jgi:predicted outer membrane repeat protein
MATVWKNEFRDNVAEQGGAIWTSGEFVLDINEPDDNLYAGNQPDDLYTDAGEP